MPAPVTGWARPAASPASSTGTSPSRPEGPTIPPTGMAPPVRPSGSGSTMPARASATRQVREQGAKPPVRRRWPRRSRGWPPAARKQPAVAARVACGEEHARQLAAGARSRMRIWRARDQSPVGLSRSHVRRASAVRPRRRSRAGGAMSRPTGGRRPSAPISASGDARAQPGADGARAIGEKSIEARAVDDPAAIGPDLDLVVLDHGLQTAHLLHGGATRRIARQGARHQLGALHRPADPPPALDREHACPGARRRRRRAAPAGPSPTTSTSGSLSTGRSRPRSRRGPGRAGGRARCARATMPSAGNAMPSSPARSA